MIAAVLFVAASVFAADKNLQDSATVYTDEDLEKYRLPSDSKEPDIDLRYKGHRLESGDATTIDRGPAHPTEAMPSTAGTKRAYSEISAILYKTST